MKDLAKSVLFCSVFLLMCVPAIAAGPVDGEVGALWWQNDLEMSNGTTSTSVDGSAPGFRAEVWLIDRYGVLANQYSSDTDGIGTESADYTSIDFMWRPFSPTKNNFVAFGLGWQQMDLGNTFGGTTSGPRLSVEGRVGLMDVLYAYGLGSYAPSLDEPTPALGTLDGLDSHELELGVSWKMAPFVSLRVGYRENSVGFTQTAESSTSSAGPFETTVQQVGGQSSSMAEGGTGGEPSLTEITTSAVALDSSGYFVGLGFSF